MAGRKMPSSKSVAEYIAELPEPLRSEVMALRKAVLAAVPNVAEEIKWNAPSFFLGEHFATMRLNGKVFLQLILHLGAKNKSSISRASIEDPSGILTWLGPDRACIDFREPGNVAAHASSVQRILQQWVRHVPSLAARSNSLFKPRRLRGSA